MRELESMIEQGRCGNLAEEKRTILEIKQLNQMKNTINQYKVIEQPDQKQLNNTRCISRASRARVWVHLFAHGILDLCQRRTRRNIARRGRRFSRVPETLIRRGTPDARMQSPLDDCPIFL